MAAFTTFAALSLAGAFAKYQYKQGKKQDRAQRDALQLQERANEDAKATALRQQRSAEQEINRAQSKQPDIASLLAAAQQAGAAGPSTSLTGPGGVDRDRLKLGRTSLLGS